MTPRTFEDVRDEVWLLLQRGEREQAAQVFAERFYELQDEGRHREFLRSTVFVRLACELADQLVERSDAEEIMARARAAHAERKNKGEEQQQ